MFGLDTEFISACFNIDARTLRENPYNMNYSVVNFDEFNEHDSLMEGFESKIGENGQLKVYKFD